MERSDIRGRSSRIWLRSMRATGLARRAENFARPLDRLRRYEHERDDARLRPRIGPVVNGASLHQHVAGAQVHRCPVDLHDDLARHNNRVVDGFGAVIARRDAGMVHADAEHRAVRVGGGDGARAAVFVRWIVGRERSGRGDDAAFMVGPSRDDVLADFVDGNDRAPLLVMAGYDAPDLQWHCWPPEYDAGSAPAIIQHRRGLTFATYTIALRSTITKSNVARMPHA